MNTAQPMVLFSVDRGNEALDREARLNAHKVLGASGIPHSEVQGQYKGQTEVSFLLPDTPRTLAIVRRLATWNAQESILRIDANNQTRLETPSGDYLASLGEFRQVSEQTAKRLDAWTRINGFYFAAGM